MTTKDTLQKIPVNVRQVLENIRKDYKNPTINQDITRKYLYGYVKGLRDAGLITERERQMLFVYGTI